MGLGRGLTLNGNMVSRRIDKLYPSWITNKLHRKPVYLEAYDETVIRHLVPRVSKSEDETKYIITVNTYFAPNQHETISGTLK